MMKNMNELRALQSAKAPEELKERTLLAARLARRAEQERAPQHLTQAPRRSFGMGKRILAAACACAVVLGGTAVWQTRGGQGETVSPVTALANTFGFVAYAADTGEALPAAQDSTIVFASGSGVEDQENGFFSGCLFRVTGENIQSVSASIDKGSLYRAKKIEIDKADVAGLHKRTDPRVQGASQVMVYGTGGDPQGEIDDVGHWYADLYWRLENGFTEAYDPDASYGFWAPSTSETDSEEDLRKAWHGRIDTFDGAKLTVTVTFTDGTQQTRTLELHTGKLAVEFLDDFSGPQYTGEVLTDEQAETQGYLYGVYAEIK
ncbi:MAG: hypothetical protein Q4C72_04815 [Eubacteriales bacterium]|nr:hypothetical protein [Eubacteriales bacterium]